MSLKTDKSVKRTADNEPEEVQLRNKYIVSLKDDVLYHLALATSTHDLQRMFGDVRFVCMGGTANRMETFSQYIKNELSYELPVGTELLDLCQKSHRFAMYKVGPVLSVSHGMGMASLSILLHEILKLVYHAKCKDPIFVRIGTSGGVGVEPGTVVITDEAVDGLLRPEHEFTILGKKILRSAELDRSLAEELVSQTTPSLDEHDTIIGKTMATDDFYEGQGRTDGAVCDHTEEEKFQFLQKIYDFGVRNIEMECTVFAALTKYTGIRSAIVCVTLVNRLNGDQLTTPKDQLLRWQLNPQVIVGRFIKNKLSILDKKIIL